MTCLFQTNLVFALFVDVAFNVTTVTCISTTDGLMFFFSLCISFSFLSTLSHSLFLSLAGFHLDRCFLSGLWRKIKHKSRCEVCVCRCVCVRMCVCMCVHVPGRQRKKHVSCARPGHFYHSWNRRDWKEIEWDRRGERLIKKKMKENV